MDIILGVDDWLPWAAPRVLRDHALESELGLLAVIASTLRGMPTLEAPPPAAMQTLRVQLGNVPAQVAHIAPESAIGQWLAIAALAEHLGEGRLAQLIVDDLRQKLEATDSTVDAVDRRELVAICWIRRGRIARIAGNHEDARECYTHALRLVRGLPWQDARPLGELGFAALAASVGNFPMVAKRAQSLLRARPPLAVVHVVSAHQMMALARRKAGDLLDALLNAWAAFDLVPTGDVRAGEMLVTLAEVASDMHDWTAAEHGFLAALSGDSPLRIKASALVGAVTARLRTLEQSRAKADVARLEGYRDELITFLDNSLAPRDALRLQLVTAETEIRIGRSDHAVARLDAAELLANRHGFFEYQFRVEVLRNELGKPSSFEEAGAVHTEQRGFSPEPIAPRNPALSRLLSIGSY